MTQLSYHLVAGHQILGHHQLPPLAIQARAAVNEGLCVDLFTLATWTSWEAA